MVKEETVVKLALKHGLIKEPVYKKLPFDINKLHPKDQVEMLRQVESMRERFKKELENKLKELGVLPLYCYMYIGGKRVRIYKESEEKKE